MQKIEVQVETVFKQVGPGELIQYDTIEDYFFYSSTVQKKFSYKNIFFTATYENGLRYFYGDKKAPTNKFYIRKDVYHNEFAYMINDLYPSLIKNQHSQAKDVLNYLNEAFNVNLNFDDLLQIHLAVLHETPCYSVNELNSKEFEKYFKNFERV